MLARASLRLVTVLTLTLVAADCRRPTVPPEPAEPALPEPSVPEGYRKIPPAPIDGPTAMLAQTASIFTGRIADVQFTYDQCAGSRTEYVFANASTIAGTRVEQDLRLQVFGGPMPNGSWARSSAQFPLALGAEYVVFLRNTDWTFSPIVSTLAFRRDQIDGQQVLVSPDGYALTGWTDEGPSFSSRAVAGTVGEHVVGYKTPDAPPAPPGASSGTPDPGPGVGEGGPVPPQVADEAFTRAPTSDQIRASGLFARPAVIAGALGNERPLSVESMASTVTGIARQAGVAIGGRLTLEPYWRCTSVTPTVRSRG